MIDLRRSWCLRHCIEDIHNYVDDVRQSSQRTEVLDIV